MALALDGVERNSSQRMTGGTEERQINGRNAGGSKNSGIERR